MQASIKHFIIIYLLLYPFMTLSKSINDWLADGLMLHGHQDSFNIRAERIVISPNVVISDINISCPSKIIRLYPVIECHGGVISFLYDNKSYLLKMIMKYDLINNYLYDAELTSLDGKLNIFMQPSEPEKIFIQLNSIAIKDLVHYGVINNTNAFSIEGSLNLDLYIDLANELISIQYYQLLGAHWESSDGANIIADLDMEGKGQVVIKDGPEIRIEGKILSGESLFGEVYTDYQKVPLDFSLLLNKGVSDHNQLSISLPDVFKAQINFSINDLFEFSKINIEYKVQNLKIFSQLILSDVLELYGLPNTQLDGVVSGSASFIGNKIFSYMTNFNSVSLSQMQKKIAVKDLNGTLHWHSILPLRSHLEWESLLLAGMPLGKVNMMFDFYSDHIVLQPLLEIPVFDGLIELSHVSFNNVFDPEIGINLEGNILPISLREITEKLNWPVMNGTISGQIPGMKKKGSVINFDGALYLQAFSGQMIIDNLSIERLFGVAPVIAADLKFYDFDLQELTGALDFGEITGSLKGSVERLRITNWKTDRMEAFIETVKKKGVKQTISQKALDRISSLGGIKGALSSSFLRFFNHFRYKKIALSCELIDSVCLIGGIEEKNNGFVIVEGGGVPKINIVGFQHKINWHEFIDRLLNANYNN